LSSKKDSKKAANKKAQMSSVAIGPNRSKRIAEAIFPVQSTLNLLEEAVAPGSEVDRFIFTSTTSFQSIDRVYDAAKASYRLGFQCRTGFKEKLEELERQLVVRRT
jgi:hypothetical protein